MSVPGWYHDPANQPGRFRYWDGTTWSQVTTTNPGDPPPISPSSPPPRRRRTALIGAAALVLVLAVVVVVVVRYIGDSRILVSDPGPSVSASRFDNTSSNPVPTASPVPSGDPADPSPSDAQPSAGQRCPVGDAAARQPHPADGRIHGGGLSFSAQTGWAPYSQATELSWAYDVGGQERAIEPEWYSVFAVGALATVDGFEAPEQAAETVLQCTASAAFYRGFAARQDLDAEAVTVGGHPGWRIRSEIQVDDPTTLPGDVVEVIVIDLGSPESLAMFWGAVPIGDQQLLAQLDQVARSLQAD